MVGATPNLTITVSNETAGLYICKASVVGFPEISATASLFLRGPPTILSHRRQYGVIGVNTRVECKAFAVPKVRFLPMNICLYVVQMFCSAVVVVAAAVELYKFVIINLASAA